MKRIILTSLSILLSYCSFGIGAISGITNVCVADTTRLTDTTAGGTWSSSTPSIATIDSVTGLITGISAGRVAITYTVGASYVTDSFTVTAPPPPPVYPSHLCVGETVISIDSTLGGYWISGNPSVALADPAPGTVTGISAGTAVISYILFTGCASTITVTVNPLPASISGISTLCIGDTTTMTDASPGGTWSSSSTAVGSIGSASGLLTGISAGFTVISYTNPLGCSASDTMHVISCSTTGTGHINVGNANVVDVYPNPVKETLTVICSQNNTTYRLLSVTGICIAHGMLQSGSNAISINECTAGVYMLETTSDSGQKDVVRIVKQ